MPIFKGSRYRGLEITPVVMNGEKCAFVNDRVALTASDSGLDPDIHEIEMGDKLDSLAWRYRGKPELWWIIAEVNGLEFAFDLKVGQKLIIPSQEIFDKYA